jgi:5-carboxymethyl-2-hydroxymuconate isomerase
MPHLTLQYTDNISQIIDFDDLFSTCHRLLNEIGNIDIKNCKSRAIELNTFYISEGNPHEGFVHLEVKFLEGRSAQIKNQIGETLLHHLIERYKISSSQQPIQLTVEILDITKENYYKFKSP